MLCISLIIVTFIFLLPSLTNYLSQIQQNRRVQIDEFTFNMDKRDKLIKETIASAEKSAKEAEKVAHSGTGH